MQEQTDCLTGESPLVQRSESLRWCRKFLLMELSVLVKRAKSFQDMWHRNAAVSDVNVDDIVDEILGAFRVATNGPDLWMLLNKTEGHVPLPPYQDHHG